ncbi:uncharacterized protein LOC125801679 [Astyanax mexicanus]|uniref:uncharacterized protein LOC125801679 n=1 Tax=Astyanax mexicanus TaxID=7994 RepID=UPI0020CB0C9B|nr:uncharacterized protein LOC125801679 [Astyanax mexicanus]
MPLKNFLERDDTYAHEELGLSMYEKKLCKHFTRVEVRGKRGRKVAVLLTPEMMRNIDLLIRNRKQCHVPQDNGYLFAIPKCPSYFRGHDCLKKYAEECGAKQPEYLRSTQLRKQVATTSQILNLKNNEIDQLADFLGHDIAVHREYYRLPDSTIQVAKISKILLALEKGKLPELRGKSLDEIAETEEDENDSDDIEDIFPETHLEDTAESNGGNIGAGSSVASSGNTDPVHKAAARAVQYTTLLPGASATADIPPSMADRVSNLKIRLCTFIAEHDLSFTVAQPLVALCKKLAEDRAALSHLSVSRQHTSYLLTHGIAPEFKHRLSEKLGNGMFSLNVDEATNKNMDKIMNVLVRFFDEDAGSVKTQHFASRIINIANAEAVIAELNDVLHTYGLDWRQVTSLLLDNCAVMRGKRIVGDLPPKSTG